MQEQINLMCLQLGLTLSLLVKKGLLDQQEVEAVLDKAEDIFRLDPNLNCLREDDTDETGLYDTN